ncbi:MAG: hypothetical protein QOF57_128 [Frankiaceae bacterium]|jgi:hypothetical protein|nr:hypothetical protein [Frankiaceae bacterium]MDQ1726400.1 hypothetical protein [Frankiaceae bacterium]
MTTTAPPADFLELPWATPLNDWTDARLVEVRSAGIHRHVVRFVAIGDEVYALKEIPERVARKEYSLLRWLGERAIPAVDVIGVVFARGGDMDAVLVTRYLEFSLSYRALFTGQRELDLIDRVLDALVQLLARLHLGGFFWADCSLSNTLFRRDAGTFEAYLVDTETAEVRNVLSDGLRAYDLDMATENVAGELADLEAGGLLPEHIDPYAVADAVARRYERLWHELTREDVFSEDEQRYRIAERLRSLNDLGFDVDEIDIVSGPDGNRLKVRTSVAEQGNNRRLLLMRTGLDVQENQARRLLNDIASYRAYLEHRDGRKVSETVAANRWLGNVFEPIMDAIPPALGEKRQPAEIFHEILVHRWYLSEQAGRDVGTTFAAQSYVRNVLPYASD